MNTPPPIPTQPQTGDIAAGMKKYLAKTKLRKPEKLGRLLFSAGLHSTLYCVNLYSASGKKTAVENRQYAAAKRGDAHPKGLRAKKRAQKWLHAHGFNPL
jgi:hypothetical protein